MFKVEGDASRFGRGNREIVYGRHRNVNKNEEIMGFGRVRRVKE